MFRIRNYRLKLKVLVIFVFLTLLMTLIIRNRYLKDNQFYNQLPSDLDNNANIQPGMEYFMNDKINLEIENDDYKNNDAQLDINLENLESEIESDFEFLANEKINYEGLIGQIDELNKNYKTVEANQRSINTNKKVYTILEYTKVFSQPKFCDKDTNKIFNSELENCEYNNCAYSCEKTDENLKRADALIFHQRDLETELISKYSTNVNTWLENTDQIPFQGKLAKKTSNNKNQIWILWNDEATSVDVSFNKISNLFNWTLSYKTDAEIYEGSYGFFKMNQNSITKNHLAKLKKEIFLYQFKRRRDAILWFVSNCKSKYRIKLALEMSKYYPVHIYGRCDPLDGMSNAERKTKYQYLKITSTNNADNNCGFDSACEINKLNTYKYYFAFENKNCTDYLTEKIWRSLNQHIIPIVFQPDSNSYKRLNVPSKSFIHLETFEFSARKLANYLNEVDKNFDMYYDHLKWTYVYMKTFYHGKFTEPHRMCLLCKKLNTFSSNVYYNRIADFFNDKCQI